jgi:streptogramin lyase/mono/diheme cytochrome c family protein
MKIGMPKNLLRALPLIVFALAPVVLHAQSSIPAMRTDYDMQQLTEPASLPAAELAGRKLFVQYCALCHDPIASPGGVTYGPTLGSIRLKALGDEAASHLVLQGTARMPGFRYMLSAAQVGQILTFLKAAHSSVFVAPEPTSRIARALPAVEANSLLRGSVLAPSVDGLAGVAVTARAQDKTFSTTVFSSQGGAFAFPALASGKYSVWAQVAGYQTAQAEVVVNSKLPVELPLELQKLQDEEGVLAQLSGVEWMNSLPAQTPADRRMKEIFRLNCTECHQANVALERRFDEAGWLAVIRFMAQADYGGWTGGGVLPGSEQSLFSEAINHYAAELAKYLARVRGPDSVRLQPKLLPRPSGAAGRAVITAYDVPPATTPNELAWRDGSDWSQGAATGMHGAVGLHDVVADDKGNAWVTNSISNNARTVVKVDVTSGQVSAFRLPPPGGPWKAQSTHGIAADSRGHLWFGRQAEPIEIDPTADTFKLFSPPVPTGLTEQIDHMGKLMGIGPVFRQGILASFQVTTDVDARDNIWSDASSGAVRFNPKTGELTYYRSQTPYWQNPPPAERFGFPFTYGVAGDADGNGWWTDPLQDRVQMADAKTGRVTEFVMRPPWADAEESAATTEADRALLVQYLGGMQWHGIKAGVQYPRRLGADKRGTAIWIPNWWGKNLARIDTRTKEVTYHKPPIDVQPYFAAVDRNHVVWINLTNDDHVASFEPSSQQWTFYRLPINGCESRHISVDDRTGSVWVPCYRASKVLRLQFPAR